MMNNDNGKKGEKSSEKADNLEKELLDLIEESETRTEAYKKIIKGIEDHIDKGENNLKQIL